MTESDEEFVREQIARLRALGTEADVVNANLLELLTPATAATVLREDALQALTRPDRGDRWIRLAHLSYLVQRERRRLGKDDRPVGMRARLWPTGKDVAYEMVRLRKYARGTRDEPLASIPSPNDSLFHDPSAPYWRRYEQP